MATAQPITFSKVRAEDLQLSDDEEQTATPMNPPIPGMGDMGGMGMGGMSPGMLGGGMGGGMLGENDEFDMEQDRTAHMQENMVGEERPVGTDGNIVKKLVHAGDGWDNPSHGYEVTLTFTGTVVNGDAAFDERYKDEPLVYTLTDDDTDGPIPTGLCKALRTFLPGERSVVTLKPEAAFGEAGSEELGVPGGATVAYDLELVKMVKVDSYADGHIKVKIVEDKHTWEVLDTNHELYIKYQLQAEDGRTVVEADGGDHSTPFVVGQSNPTYPAFFGDLLPNLKAENTYEIIVDAEATAGDDKLPAGAPLRGTLTVVRHVEVDTVRCSAGEALRKLLTGGEGYDKPQRESELHVRYGVTVEGGAVERSFDDSDVVVYRYGAHGAAGLPPVFEKVVDLISGQTAEFICRGAVAGRADDAAVTFKVQLETFLDIRTVAKTFDKVVMKVLVKNKGYERPNDGAEVKVHLATWPTDSADKPFEDSATAAEGEPITCRVGDGTLPAAVEFALVTMTKGSKAELTIDSAFGYTLSQCLDRKLAAEAANTDLGARVELVDFTPAKDDYDMDDEERVAIVDVRINQGRDLAKLGRWELALAKFDRAVALLDATEDETAHKDKKICCHSNLSLSHLQLGDHKKTVEEANKVQRAPLGREGLPVAPMGLHLMAWATYPPPHPLSSASAWHPTTSKSSSARPTPTRGKENTPTPRRPSHGCSRPSRRTATPVRCSAKSPPAWRRNSRRRNPCTPRCSPAASWRTKTLHEWWLPTPPRTWACPRLRQTSELGRLRLRLACAGSPRMRPLRSLRVACGGPLCMELGRPPPAETPTVAGPNRPDPRGQGTTLLWDGGGSRGVPGSHVHLDQRPGALRRPTQYVLITVVNSSAAAS